MSRAGSSRWVIVCAVAVFAVGIWYLAHSSTTRKVGETTLPGNEVNVGLGRNAVIVQGDPVDPIQTAWVLNGSAPVPLENVWRRSDGSCLVVFCDVGKEPIQVRVRTRFRDTQYPLQPSDFRYGVELTSVVLDLPDDLPEGVPDTALAFSPDGHRLAIGSAFGELQVIAVSGAKGAGEYSRRIPEGAAKALAFSADGEVLVVGEQSPDGFVYGLNPRGSKELWRLRLADELETSRPSANDYGTLYQFPGAARMVALPDGDVLVLGRHSWRPDAQSRQARSRLYRINARTGEVRWRFPAAAPERRNITWFDASRDGSRIVCALSIPGAGQLGAGEAPLEVMALDGKTGALTGRLELPPLKPHFTSALSWQSLSLRPDGAGGILGADDGRVWALSFNEAGQPAARWLVDLGTPIQAGGLMVHCGVGWALASTKGYFVELDRNWEQHGAATRTGQPANLHPEACSIHAFDAGAETPQRLWRYQVACRPQGLWLSSDERWLGFAYEQPEGMDAKGRPTPPDYGVLMLDLNRPGSGAEKLRYRYSSEGPIGFSGCFSSDGRYLAVTEGPRPGSDRMTGTRIYRVLVLH
jgi:hypothetical protein